MKKKNGFTALMGLGFAALLAACGNASDPSEAEVLVTDSGAVAEGPVEEAADSGIPLFAAADFNQVTSNTAAPIEGGTLNFGLVTSTTFPGVLNAAFNEAADDATIMEFFAGTLLEIDDSFLITQDGAATFEISEDGKTFTFTIHDNVYWHDGTPVTARDWVFAHEVIASPDYTGVRFGPNMRNIVGVDEYRAGEADSISGLRILSDRVLEMEFIEVTPTLLVGAGGIWGSPLPYHILGDVPVAEMPDHPAVRINPIGFGPFVVDHIVPGESVTFSRNENYWRGTPNLDGIVLRTVNPELIAAELANGNIDIASFPTSQFEQHYDMSNVEFLGMVAPRYDFLGFKLGHWDADLGENVMDPDAKMANPDLRLAMWKAIDNSAVGDNLFHGLRWEASTLIPPSHPFFHDETLQRPAFDPAAAAAILDEAGFAIGADGYRQNPDGTELVINFWAMTGDSIQDALVGFYVQSWQDIGLNINLTQQEFNTFYDHVAADDENIDVYLASWSIGTNVAPDNLYGRSALWNESRFVSENNDRLLAAGLSSEALDPEFRQAIYNEWQAYMLEQMPVIPTLFHIGITAVNNRVTNYSIGNGTGIFIYQLGVTAEEGYRN